MSAVDTKDAIKSYSVTKAAGIFKILTITATNKDKEPRMLDNNMFRIVDDQGNPNRPGRVR